MSQQSDAANVSLSGGPLTTEKEDKVVDLSPSGVLMTPIKPDPTHFLISVHMISLNWHVVEAVLKRGSIGGSRITVHVPWQTVEQLIEMNCQTITRDRSEVFVKQYLGKHARQYPNLHVQNMEEAAEMQRAFHDGVFKTSSGIVQLWRTIADTASNKNNVIVIGIFYEKELLQECGMHKITLWTPCTLSNYLFNDASPGSLTIEDEDKMDLPCLSDAPIEEQPRDPFVVLFNPDATHFIITSGMVASFWHVVEDALKCGSIAGSQPMVHLPWQAVEELKEMRSRADPGDLSGQTVEEYLAEQARLYPNLHVQEAEEAAQMQREFHGGVFKTESGVVQLWCTISDAVSRTDNVIVVALIEERRIVQECSLHKIIWFSPSHLLGYLMGKVRKGPKPSSKNVAAVTTQKRNAPISVEISLEDQPPEQFLSGYCILL